MKNIRDRCEHPVLAITEYFTNSEFDIVPKGECRYCQKEIVIPLETYERLDGLMILRNGIRIFLEELYIKNEK